MGRVEERRWNAWSENEKINLTRAEQPYWRKILKSILYIFYNKSVVQLYIITLTTETWLPSMASRIVITPNINPVIWVSWQGVSYLWKCVGESDTSSSLQIQTDSQTPNACSPQFQELPRCLCLSTDMGTSFYPYFTFSQYSSAHRKVRSAGLISLPFEQIICQSVLGTGMLLVLWSTFSAVKSGIQIKWLMSCQ